MNENNEKKKFNKASLYLIIPTILIVLSYILFGQSIEDDTLNENNNSQYDEIKNDNLNYISDEVECSNWRIKLDSIEKRDVYSDTSESTYFIVTFYATNIGNKEDTFYASYVTAQKGNIVYEHTNLLSPDNFDTARNCPAHITEKFVMTFEVPRGSNYNDFVLKFQFIINSTEFVLKYR